MTLLQALILGIIQGATEFIPVSSSGHLVITPWLLEWRFDPQAAFVFDILAHWGTLIALVIYFRRDLVTLIRNTLQGLFSKPPWKDPWARTAWFILVATLPAALLGYLTRDFFERTFSNPIAASGFLILTAMVLAVGEIKSKHINPRQKLPMSPEGDGGEQQGSDFQLNPPQGLTLIVVALIGIAQALALFPGISRSGITIAAGLMLGLNKVDAARFSFLLAIPAMFGAGILAIYDLLQSIGLHQMAPSFLIGFAFAALVGYLAIRWLLAYLDRGSLIRFAVYCLILGLVGLTFGALRS